MDQEQNGDVRFSGAALRGKEVPPSPSASVASNSSGASKGYLVHVLVAGSPG